MESITFWNTYVQDTAPADFVWRYGKGKIAVAVEVYLQQRSCLFGIVRRGSWKETFGAQHQFNRESICTGLTAYLSETEETWRHQVEEARQTEIRAKAEAKARAEAEALALAVARVEAEARARAEAEQKGKVYNEAEVVPFPTPASDGCPESEKEGSPSNEVEGAVNLRSDAEAIALAMARVEAEARARTEREQSQCSNLVSGNDAVKHETLSGEDAGPQSSAPVSTEMSSNTEGGLNLSIEHGRSDDSDAPAAS